MAVVEGPLHSTNARGTIFGTNTHFNWKGLHVVRNRVSPVQPRTAAVMNSRIKVKVLGKVSKLFSPTSTLMGDIKLETPARKPWNAWWIGVAVKQFQGDNDAYDVLYADFIACTAEPAAWIGKAENMGLAPQTLTVEGKSADHPETYSEGLALYSLAKACWYMEVLDENDVAYTDPAAWDAPAMTAFANRVLD